MAPRTSARVASRRIVKEEVREPQATVKAKSRSQAQSKKATAGIPRVAASGRVQKATAKTTGVAKVRAKASRVGKATVKVEMAEEEVRAAKPAAKATVSRGKSKKASAPVARVAASGRVQKATSAKTNGVAKVPAKTTHQNAVPSQPLDILVFGQGENAELGLGSVKYDGKLRPVRVKRPRLNHNLAHVNVVQSACGGMHAVVLTKENKILTWGVNDDKALGRDTTWDGGVRDVDMESDVDDDDDAGLNPKEAVPAEIDTSNIPANTIFVKVAASNSASFALTQDGQVYGWGTFRGTEGVIGFSKGVTFQTLPVLIPHLSGIVDIATGYDHAMALDKNGKVWAWGNAEQGQLGRTPPESRRGGADKKEFSLVPEVVRRFYRHKAVKIFAGSYQSFYVDDKGHVWSFGLNNYGQTGHPPQAIKDRDEPPICQPTKVTALQGEYVTCIAAGSFHAVACTETGKLLTWGRIDGHQVGHKPEVFNEDNTISDDNGPGILTVPTAVAGVEDVTFVAASSDTSMAVTKDGKVYSWGFSAMYQTGQGTTEDIEEPTLIDNSAVKDRLVVWAGSGGQFGMLAAKREVDAAGDVVMTGL